MANTKLDIKCTCGEIIRAGSPMHEAIHVTELRNGRSRSERDFIVICHGELHPPATNYCWYHTGIKRLTNT